MRPDLQAVDLMLVVLEHRHPRRLRDGIHAQDILDVRIVHRPLRFEWEDNPRPVVSGSESACGHDFADGRHYGAFAVVDRRILNMSALPKCRHQACFGGR